MDSGLSGLDSSTGWVLHCVLGQDHSHIYSLSPPRWVPANIMLGNNQGCAGLQWGQGVGRGGGGGEESRNTQSLHAIEAGITFRLLYRLTWLNIQALNSYKFKSHCSITLQTETHANPLFYADKIFIYRFLPSPYIQVYLQGNSLKK